MVRLEKIIYEQLVNTRQLKRERILDRPKKWYNEARNPAFKVASVKFCTEGLTGAIFRFIEPVFAKFSYQWQQDYLLQRGLAMEDMIVFQDRELRRCPLYENIARQSFNPYQYILFAKRRARYYKVERGVRGSYAPEYLQKEAQQRTLAESSALKDEWDNFVYQQFMSDMTPTARGSTMQKVIFLEYFQFYGPFRLDAWSRYFYNETSYRRNEYSAQQVNSYQNPWKCNLSTDAGRRKFEAEVTRFQQLYPGSLTRPGEKFDFERIYAIHALKNGQDVSKFDSNLIASLRAEAEQKVEEKTGTKARAKKASYVPEHRRTLPGRAFFN